MLSIGVLGLPFDQCYLGFPHLGHAVAPAGIVEPHPKQIAPPPTRATAGVGYETAVGLSAAYDTDGGAGGAVNGGEGFLLRTVQPTTAAAAAPKIDKSAKISGDSIILSEMVFSFTVRSAWPNVFAPPALTETCMG